MTTTTLERVYVWEVPVRLYHWVNAVCLLVLCATGYFIGGPISVNNGGEAWRSFWFGTVRFVHFAFAFVFFFNFLGRIYWGFVGNDYVRWRHFFPLTPTMFKRQLAESIEVLKVDILQARVKPMDSIGHNALAAWTYGLVFLAFALQSVTGFGMYAAMSTAWLPHLFAWIVPLMGGDFMVRQLHHALMWFFIVFALMHVYLVFYHDYVEGRGILSSMGGGWKFIERR